MLKTPSPATPKRSIDSARGTPSQSFTRRFGESIFAYTDFRSFLQSYWNERKAFSKGYSLARFARELKLKDASSIHKILRGHREPGRKVCENICHFFEWDDRRSLYFYDLVELAKEQPGTARGVYLMERLKQLHPSGEFRLLNSDEFGVIANWYSVAIREMVKLADFREDLDWISDRLRHRVGKTEIRDGLAALERLGLVVRKNGRLQIGPGRFQSTHGVQSEAIKRFHEASLDLVRDTIRTVPLERRYISSSTVSISRSQIARARELLGRYQDEFCKIIESPVGQGEEVYQLNFQFIPITEEKSK